MTRSRAQDPDVCGVTAAIAVIDGKWKTLLLWLLESRPHRPGELRRRLPGLTEKVLTQALREMESDGLVHREVHDERPLKTVYSLTPFGRDLSGRWSRSPNGATAAWRLAASEPPPDAPPRLRPCPGAVRPPMTQPHGTASDLQVPTKRWPPPPARFSLSRRLLQAIGQKALEMRARHDVVVRAVALDHVECGPRPRDPCQQPLAVAGHHLAAGRCGPGGQHRPDVRELEARLLRDQDRRHPAQVRVGVAAAVARAGRCQQPFRLPVAQHVRRKPEAGRHLAD